MSYSDKLQTISDWTTQAFAAVTTVTGIVPVQLNREVVGNTAAFDFLEPVASHIYFIENISVREAGNLTGSPVIESYDITPTVQDMFDFRNVGQSLDVVNFWCTRLAHLPGTANPGLYSIQLTGFDITYT